MSSACPFCAKDFYLKAATVDSSDLIKKPDTFCLACPVNTNCDKNTTIKTLKGNPDFWRYSLDTQEYYECEKSEGCQGGDSCAEGYEGILCETCVDEKEYLDDNGKCTKCPHLSRVGILPGIVFLVTMMILMVHNGMRHFPALKHLNHKVFTFVTRARMQAKLNMIISFYQVMVAFEPIYGVRMHSAFTSWFSFFRVFNFGFDELFGIPGPCIGSMKNRMLVTATWPFVTILLFVTAIRLHTFKIDMKDIGRKEAMAKFRQRAIHATVVLVYFILHQKFGNVDCY